MALLAHACSPKVATRSENRPANPKAKQWSNRKTLLCCKSTDGLNMLLKHVAGVGPNTISSDFASSVRHYSLRGTTKARFTYAVGSSAGNTNRTILPGVCDCHFNLCRKPLLFPVSQNHKFSELVKARASCSLTSFCRLPVFH